MKTRYLILGSLVGVTVLVIVWGTLIRPMEGRESVSSVTDKIKEGTRGAIQIAHETAPLDPDEEKRIGDRLHRRIQNRFEILPREHAWSRYVGAVGMELLSNVEDQKNFPYKFHVVRSDRINAFAIAGGHIYIMTGMLDLIETEAELAGLIAHEIGHVELDHCADAVRYQQKQSKNESDVVGRLLRALVRRSFSTDLERNADLFGMQLSARTRYNPLGLSHLFSEMLSHRNGSRSGQNQDTGHRSADELVEEALEEYLATHPDLSERVETIRRKANGRADWQDLRFYRGETNVQQRTPRSKQTDPNGWIRPFSS